MQSNPTCGFKEQAIRQFVCAVKCPDGAPGEDNEGSHLALHAHRVGFDATHTGEQLSVSRLKGGRIELRGDVCHPGVDAALVALSAELNEHYVLLGTSMTSARVMSPLTDATAPDALSAAARFVSTGLTRERQRLVSLNARLEQMMMRVESGESDVVHEAGSIAGAEDDDDEVDGLGLQAAAARLPDAPAAAPDEADALDDYDGADATACLSAVTAAVAAKKNNLACSLRKLQEFVRKSQFQVAQMEDFVTAEEAVSNGVANSVRPALLCAEAAITASLNSQRTAANQILEIRLRDLVNGLSSIAARFVVRDPTADLLATLVSATVDKVNKIVVNEGANAGRAVTIVSSDGEGRRVLWEGDDGQHAQTTTEVRARAQRHTAAVAAEAEAAVQVAKNSAIGGKVAGILKMKKDVIKPHVVRELLVAHYIALHSALCRTGGGAEPEPLHQLDLYGASEDVLVSQLQILASSLLEHTARQATGGAPAHDAVMGPDDDEVMGADEAGVLFATTQSRIRESAGSGGGALVTPDADVLSAALRAHCAGISSRAISATTRDENIVGSAVGVLAAYDDEVRSDAPLRADVEGVLETLGGSIGEALSRGVRRDQAPHGADASSSFDVVQAMRRYIEAHPVGSRKRKKTGADAGGESQPERMSVGEYFKGLVDSYDVGKTAAVAFEAAGAPGIQVCASLRLALTRVETVCSSSHSGPGVLLKILRKFRYQNQLVIAKEASQACLARVHRDENVTRTGAHQRPLNGPHVDDGDLMYSTVYFPQQNQHLSLLLGRVALIIGHEDYVHKAKRAASGVSSTRNDDKDPLFDRPLLMAAAARMQGATGVGIARVLGGTMGVDVMSFGLMKQIFCCSDFRVEVQKTLPVQAEALLIFGDFFDAFDRSGLSTRRRIVALQRFVALFDAIMPSSFWDSGYMPQSVGGLPSSVWLALRRDADSFIFLNAIYPWHVFCGRYLGTFDLETGFSVTVTAAGRYKPNTAAALDVMDRADMLSSILLKSDIKRGFYRAPPRRGNQSQYQASEAADAAIFSGRVQAWVHDTGDQLQPIGRDASRVRHALVNYAVNARDFLKGKMSAFAQAST